MNKIYFYLLSLIVLSFSVHAQILNGGFEQWSSGEPTHWKTNNINEEGLSEKFLFITRTTDSYTGSYALKGEVLGNASGSGTTAPWIFSGDENKQYFPFSGRPKKIRGYYKCTLFDGDSFVSGVFLLKGEDLVAIGGVTIYASNSSEWRELVMDLTYLDSTSVPTGIQFDFRIQPPDPGNPQSMPSLGSKFYIDGFPAISLIKPSEEETQKRYVFISGEADTIKWDGGGTQNVDLEYSIDDGNSYNQIVSNYPADSNRYFWKVPSTLLTRKGKIRIKESQNADNKKESKQVSFKPWQLTRIEANDKLELFEPNEDGWKFSNKRSNVWPYDWWKQFDYSETDPLTDEPYPKWFPFITAHSYDFPDWPLFVDVFGQEICYGPENTYREEAKTHWGGISQGIRGKWGGSCFGFSVSSLLGFYHKASLIPKIGGFTDLYNVPKGVDSRLVVNHYMVHQFSKKVRALRGTRYNYTPRDLLQDAKDLFRKEDGDGRILYYSNNRGSGAHEVTPYKLKRVGPSSSFNLYVYDNRLPGSENARILIDSSSNKWTDYTGLDWGEGSRGCFFELESGDFLSRPTFPGTTDKNLAKVNSSKLTTEFTLYNSTFADILITARNGNQIGFKDSTAFSNIIDGVPIIPATTSYQPPIGYDLPFDTYSIQMSNFEDTSSYAFFLSDETIYNYRRSSIDPNEIDILKYSESGVGIINPDIKNKIMVLEAIILEDSTSEKVFSVNKIEVSAGDSIHIREKDRNELLLKNYGESSKYDLQIRTVSAKGQSIFNRAEILLSKNSSHQIVPVWENLEEDPVKILIDNGNDGTFDDSLIVTKEVTGIEKNNYVGISKKYMLLQNYPNPFNPSTTISFKLPQKSEVNLTIYNTLGQVVATLINEIKQAGQHQIVFDASDLSNGVYIYKIKAGSYSAAKKMILLK